MDKSLDFARKRKLIAEVEARPILWDRRLEERKDAVTVQRLWLEVSNELGGCAVEDVKKQWKNLVDQFRVQHRKLLKNTCSSSSIDDVRKKAEVVRWPFFKAMVFMHPIMVKRPTLFTIALESLDMQDSNGPTPSSNPHLSFQSGEIHSLDVLQQDAYLDRLATPDHGSTSTDNNNARLSLKRKERENSSGEDEHPSPKKSSPHETFGIHISDLIGKVPVDLQVQCMREVTNMIYAYIDSKIPIITIPDCE